MEVVRKNFWFIIGMISLFGEVAVLVTNLLMTSRSEAKTHILVTQSEDTNFVHNQDIQDSLQLINIYWNVILSQAVFEEVSKKSEIWSKSAETLRNQSIVSDDLKSSNILPFDI